MFKLPHKRKNAVCAPDVVRFKRTKRLHLEMIIDLNTLELRWEDPKNYYFDSIIVF